jgi:SAM-dependent methyltransferase
MDRHYWEKIAPAYNEEIFDVLENDKKAIIHTAINRLAKPSRTVMDIGCAVGKWLPLLSPRFKKVIAVDISEKNLSIAKKTYSKLSNIDYLRADMSGPKLSLHPCHVAICINAILTDSLKKRMHFFRNLSSCIRKGGSLVLAVPSLESSLLTHVISHQWKIDRDMLGKKISGKQALKKWNNIKQGNTDIDNIPTKHYLKEELELLLYLEGFSIENIQKIEYDWTTEFTKPPKWLKNPRPWDWMVVARKN